MHFTHMTADLYSAKGPILVSADALSLLDIPTSFLSLSLTALRIYGTIRGCMSVCMMITDKFNS